LISKRGVSKGAPSNPCNDCHGDRPASWAAAAVERWHGPDRKDHQRFAAAFHAARIGDPAARERLLAIARDKASPAVARATAVSLLPAWPAAATTATVVAAALDDPDPLVRTAALRSLESEPAERRWFLGSPKRADASLIVRLAAAELLAAYSFFCQNSLDKSLGVLIRNVTHRVGVIICNGSSEKLKQRGGAGQGCSAALRRYVINSFDF